MPSGFENLLAQITLTEHGIASDQAALQHQSLEQSQRGFVLVGLVGTTVGDLGLGDRQPRLMGDQRQEMNRLLHTVEAAPGGLTIHSKGLERDLFGGWRPTQQGLGPSGEGGFQGNLVQRHEHLADAPRLEGSTGEPEAVHQRNVVVAGPLADGRVATGTAKYCAARQRQHGRQRMLAAVTAARVGDLGEKLKQTKVSARVHARASSGASCQSILFLSPPNQICQWPWTFSRGWLLQCRVGVYLQLESIEEIACAAGAGEVSDGQRNVQEGGGDAIATDRPRSFGVWVAGLWLLGPRPGRRVQ